MTEDQRFGPNTAEVERVLDLATRACGQGPIMWFFTVHYERDFIATRAIRERAEALARERGLGQAWQEAYDAGYGTAYAANHCAAEDATFATAFVAQAVAVREILTPADFDALYRVWGEIFGPPSPASVSEAPPPWPPALAYGDSCGAKVCLHGKLKGERPPD